MVWPRSGEWSGLGSVRSAQWSGQCRVSLANGGQSLFSLANGSQILFGLANTHILVWPTVWTRVWRRVCSVWPLVWTTVWRMVWPRSGLGSLRSVQWSGQCLVSPANGGQSLFSLANGSQSLFGLANTYLWVWSVWPMPVLGMVGLAINCRGSRTSSWVVTLIPARARFKDVYVTCLPNFQLENMTDISNLNEPTSQ